MSSSRTTRRSRSSAGALRATAVDVAAFRAEPARRMPVAFRAAPVLRAGPVLRAALALRPAPALRAVATPRLGALAGRAFRATAFREPVRAALGAVFFAFFLAPAALRLAIAVVLSVSGLP